MGNVMAPPHITQQQQQHMQQQISQQQYMQVNFFILIYYSIQYTQVGNTLIVL